MDKEAPLYKKHLELKSFYDFGYDYELIKNHYPQILDITKSPNDYMEWIRNVDIQNIFEKLKS